MCMMYNAFVIQEHFCLAIQPFSVRRMADSFSITGGETAIADVCWHVIKYLLATVATLETEINDWISEIESLTTVTWSRIEFQLRSSHPLCKIQPFERA